MLTEASVVSGPIAQALVARVESAILAMRADDPFRPVHVLVPNHVLGTLFARSLFAGTGYLAIYCELPHEFAWRVAATDCLTEGVLPVPEEVDLAIVLSAAAQAVEGEGTPDYLRRAVQMPGFAPAALRTLRDLAASGVGPDALHAFAAEAPDPDKLRVLARIARAQQAAIVSAGLVDRETLYRRAAATLATVDSAPRPQPPSPKTRVPGPGVVLVGSPPPSRAFETLAARIKETHPCAWVAWPAPDGIAPRHDAARAEFSARTHVARATASPEPGGGPGYAETAAKSMPRGHAPHALERVQKLLFVEGAKEQPAEPRGTPSRKNAGTPARSKTEARWLGGAGTPRRLMDFHRQIEHYDLGSINADAFWGMLPREFGKFKQELAASPPSS